jgi:hypothetical protein
MVYHRMNSLQPRRAFHLYFGTEAWYDDGWEFKKNALIKGGTYRMVPIDSLVRDRKVQVWSIHGGFENGCRILWE